MNLESLEDIKVLMDNFDPASLLPDLTSVVGVVETVVRVAVMAGPLVLLVMGLLYFLVSPKEANYQFGYRCFYGMGSVEAWRFSQKLAGIVWAALGLVLSVVMLLLTGGFSAMPIMDVISFGIKCLLWEMGLALVSVVVINLITAIRFDRRGDRREKAPEEK